MPPTPDEGGAVRWNGLRAPGHVEHALGDLGVVGSRLTEARMERQGRAETRLSNALDGIALAMNSLVDGNDVKCTLAEPPEDLSVRPWGKNGALITRCYHDPPHCWNGIGDRIDCNPS